MPLNLALLGFPSHRPQPQFLCTSYFNPPMAGYQTTNSANLRPLNLNNRTPPAVYPEPSPCPLSWAPPSVPPIAAIPAEGVMGSVAEEAGGGEEKAVASPRRVKLLCGFGGRVLPRPSDGTLRYVGGHTRIISFRRDTTFPELMAKMADAYGGPVAFKYQLPDEDLDALVSVSSPEDLENMMEEYDKLAEASPDGSAKLRVFLFPLSDPGLDPSGGADLLGEAHDDNGQRYVDAVNGLLTPEPPVLRRKDSATSATSAASSTQNSDCPTLGDATDTTTIEGTPSALQSPNIAAATKHDSSRLAYVSGAATFPDAPMVGLGIPVPTSNLAPVAPYVPPPAYMNPTQVQYMNPQQLGVVGGPSPINTQAFVPVHAFMPRLHVATAPQASQVSNTVKPIQTSYLEENPYGARAAQLPSDHSYKAHLLLSQLPPLRPTHLPMQNVERYDLRQVPQPLQELQQGQSLRLEDCYMCQKALPHAHSDTLIQENGNGSVSSVPEVNPVFYSHHSEDAMRQRGQHRVVTGTMSDNVVEPTVESVIRSSHSGTYGITHTPEVQYGSERQPILKAENFDHSRVWLPPGAMSLPPDIPTSYVTLSSKRLQSHLEDSLQQQQQQQQTQQNLVPPQYPVKPDVIAKPIVTDVSSVKNANLQAAEPVPGCSHDYVRPIDEMMESLHIIPPEVSKLDEQGKPVVRPNAGIPKDLKPDIPPLVVENGYIARPQLGGNAMYTGNGFINSGMISEENFVKPVEQLLPNSFDDTHLHNFQPVDTSHIFTITGSLRPYPDNLESGGLEPPVPNERLLGMPSYSHNFDPLYDNDGAKKDQSSLFPSKNVPNPIAPPLCSNLPSLSLNSNSPTEHKEYFQETLQSDSLFSNQDPWKIVGGTNLLPPKPNKVASKEPLISKDQEIENYLEHSNGSNLVALLEEAVFCQPLNPLNKNCLEPIRSTKGLTEEQVKQDLQAVAEGVAASVLQSSTHPVPLFYAHERKECAPEFNKEKEIIEENTESQSAAAIVDHKIEDIKSEQLEKVNLGLPIADDIGHLQIIKNSDLEELQELGSGTFGTVYHGKWRGTDVAIKRINDRCFAGKPSEQERMRVDFWNEACKLADLHHPNVVAFYGVVLDGPGGSVATVTEFMVNGSLRHALQRNEKTLDRRKRLLIAMDVAFGMEYLHGKNIVHFDLKSDNLLVNLRDPQRPICKVADLGLSKVKCQTLISGGVRGTLPWMAPELLNGSSSLVSEKVDVFSFGIVMWELLTREEPYADLHYGAIIGGIVSNTLRPPVPESCDPEWRSLMEQCWSAEPSERPSFTEIANRLRCMPASRPQKGSAPAHPAAQPHVQK